MNHLTHLKRSISLPIACLLLALSFTSHAQEAIFTDDFERYEVGENVKSLGYNSWNNDFVIASDGKNKFIKSSEPKEKTLFFKELQLIAGRTYELTVTAKRSAAEDTYILSARTPDNTVIEQAFLKNGDAWETAKLKFKVGRGQETVRFSIWQTPDVELFIDNIKLIDTNETQSLSTLVSSIFSDGMVLQRNSKVKFWGKDKEGQKVTVTTSWNNKSYKAKADKNGEWSVKVATQEAGGPFEIQISGTEEVAIKDVLLGDVWLCSGQSNMAWVFQNGVDGGKEVVANSKNPMIRNFDLPKTGSLEPQFSSTGSWKEASPETLNRFMAVPYFFGKILHDSLNVPIGLITSAYGGSKIEAWMDVKTLEAFDFVEIPKELEGKKINKESTVLYNAMIHPIAGYGIKGATWYQGEANRSEPEQYKQLLPTMINAWRTIWDQGDFPFYFVQIAPFANQKLDFWQMLSEVHASTENTGMVITMDVGDCEDIHPTNKKPVGERLARWALREVYGYKGFDTSGPIAQKATLSADKITVQFDYAESGIQLKQGDSSGFEIAGEDRKFVPAEAQVNADRSITFSSSKVAKPKYVRYGQDHCSKMTVSLFSKEGLPGAAFEMEAN